VKWITQMTAKELEQLEKAITDLKDRDGCDCGK
jgi:hypothetical protein